MSEDFPIVYKKNYCFVNAFINQKKFYKGLNLKYVIGSLAINGKYEFGNKENCFTLEVKNNIKSWDAHAWLEDDEGNVYDYAYKSYNKHSRKRAKKDFNFSGIIYKKSKKELKELGLLYVPAPKDIQTKIFLSLYKELSEEANYIISILEKISSHKKVLSYLDEDKGDKLNAKYFMYEK